jgi:hypothetical protein
MKTAWHLGHRIRAAMDEKPGVFFSPILTSLSYQSERSHVMATVDDTIDQCYALFVANNILCMRMWGYMSVVFAKAEGTDAKAYIEKHRKMSLQSADMWKLEGHRNPDKLRQMVRDQLNLSWDGITMGLPSGSRPQ